MLFTWRFKQHEAILFSKLKVYVFKISQLEIIKISTLFSALSRVHTLNLEIQLEIFGHMPRIKLKSPNLQIDVFVSKQKCIFTVSRLWKIACRDTRKQKESSCDAFVHCTRRRSWPRPAGVSPTTMYLRPLSRREIIR